MNNPQFHCKFADIILEFIDQKHSIGYPYKHSSLILSRFDNMVVSEFQNEDTITKAMCDTWIEKHKDLHQNTLTRDVTPVRQLAKYMNGIGKTAYVIPSYIGRKQLKYPAHIYTMQEKRAFFQSVDLCKPATKKSPTKHYVVPVIFRLMYCCGLRESEALNLSINDVNLDDGMITIRESKGWKARNIFMSEDMIKQCRQYNAVISKKFPERSAFFPNKDGETLSYYTLNKWFHEFWDILPESKNENTQNACLHSFRHTFAVDRLNAWVREGKDISAMSVYLSEYMGHLNYNATDYYLQLVSEFYPDMEEKLSSMNKNILPEVCHEKE